MSIEPDLDYNFDHSATGIVVYVGILALFLSAVLLLIYYYPDNLESETNFKILLNDSDTNTINFPTVYYYYNLTDGSLTIKNESNFTR